MFDTAVRLAANRLTLPCSAEVQFLLRLQAEVSLEYPMKAKGPAPVAGP